MCGVGVNSNLGGLGGFSVPGSGPGLQGTPAFIRIDY